MPAKSGPSTQPHTNVVTHYWNSAPAPCSKAGELLGYAASGVGATYAVWTGAKVAVTGTSPASMWVGETGGQLIGSSVVARFGYFAGCFVGKAADGTVGLANIAFNTLMYKHFNSTEREQIYHAQIYLNRFLLVLPDALLQQCFYNIIARYDGMSYRMCQSDASKALMVHLTGGTSLQNKLRHVLAYIWDADNIGKNMFNVACEEILHLQAAAASHPDASTYEGKLKLKVNGIFGIVEEGTPAAAAIAPEVQLLLQTMAAFGNKGGDREALLCPKSKNLMTFPVKIPEGDPCNGDGRAYDLSFLLQYKATHGGAKLLGCHGRDMTIDLDNLEVDREAFKRLQKFYEHQSNNSPEVKISVEEAKRHAKIARPSKEEEPGEDSGALKKAVTSAKSFGMR